MIRSTPLSRGAGPARKTALARGTKPIATFGKRRASQRDKRKEVVAAVLERDGHRCQALDRLRAEGLDGTCGGPLDVHEVIPRSAWSGGYLVPANCLAVCRKHHDWIGNAPNMAHALGLHGMSWERPS